MAVNKTKKTRRDPMGSALSLLTKASTSSLVQRLNLQKPLEKVVTSGSKATFRAMSVANKRVRPLVNLASPQRQKSATGAGLFDLTPTDDQQMFRDTAERFAAEQIRPAAEAADEACATPVELLQQAHELGFNLIGMPEELGGMSDEWNPVTALLVAETLAHGDMGIALAMLSPAGVINALTAYGTAEQQGQYLPYLAGEQFVPATVAIAEPQPLFNPNKLATQAVRNAEGYLLNGQKSLVPLAETAELMLVAAEVAGLGPRLFILEPGFAGLSIEAEPAMGLRAAALGRLTLENVQLPVEAMLGGEPAGKTDEFDYQAILSRLRLGWSALALGSCQAALDYVIPYVKERKAFGEPVAHKQAVAFMVANIGIELDGMRLLVWRAASRAGQGLSYQREAYLAALQCGEKGMEIGTNAVQLLGGHGFIKEHPVERWYRHLRGVALMPGGFLV